MYYRGAAAAIVVYDITKEVYESRFVYCLEFRTLVRASRVSWSVFGSCSLQESFTRAKDWVKELQRGGSPNIVIALAGNKTDLSIKRKVQSEVCVAPSFTVYPLQSTAVNCDTCRTRNNIRRKPASCLWKLRRKPHRMSMSCL
eukprot:SAG31_NODE_1944_length_6856_cov_3.850969_8_plen_143_part_00